MKSHSKTPKFWRAFSSLRTGIVLLIIVGLGSAAGTLVLQRPATEADKLRQAYSPATLHWLDTFGLTDVFHAWWFAALLALLGINIALASIERFPTAWHYFSRPYRRPESHFLKGLAVQKEIPIHDIPTAILAAERAFRRQGFRPQRLGDGPEVSLYVEKHRAARLAPYVVHASLLLIFAGGITDAVWGYRGFVALGLNDEADKIELSSGTRKQLPFTVRCQGAGQENYPDGTPRRWWSELVVLENGREVKRKEIAVNDPLVYRGVRFFQSSYGSTGQVNALELSATSRNGTSPAKDIELRPDSTVALDASTTVRLAAFIPDFVLSDGQVESRSDQPNNPAIQLTVNSKQAGDSTVWLFPRYPEFSHPDKSPYSFQVKGINMGYYTGLQVAHEPGQWAVWAGVLLMGVGLALAFYFVHVRFWIVPVNDGRGRLVLWAGASASKNREELERRFDLLVEAIEQNLKTECACWDLEAATFPART